MRNLLYKEFKLTSLKLTYFFILFSLMSFIPGYPILLGAFFLSLGIFQSFENARLQNDILFSLLLPINKRNIVISKYCYVIILEAIFFLLCLIFTVCRLLLLSDAAIYETNKMMNANLAYLGYILMLLGLFNSIFVGGFFKTAYYVGKPFLTYGASAFLVIFIAEAIHHFPGLGMLNSAREGMGIQALILLSGVVFYSINTLCSIGISIKRFEQLDL